MEKKPSINIPEEVSRVPEELKKAGFEAYLVGGCVRDVLSGRKPKDWDVTTNAQPEKIERLFANTFYENDYGTVGIVNEDISDETLKVIEVTPYRIEGKYSDKRRPDTITFAKTLEDDLKRRDFTINAIALSIEKISGETHKFSIIDPHGGSIDLTKGIIRAVGKADERFKEDALRVLRAVRIATEMKFVLDKDTEAALIADGDLLGHISAERIRDEFVKILMSDMPADGLRLAHKLGILKYILPELEEGIGIEQNKAHAFDVWEHLLKTLQHSADKKWPLHIRLAAILHDISKPETRRKNPSTGEWTFYGHDVVGARKVRVILERLKFSHEIIDKVTRLVRWHMFFSDTETITLSAVRRLATNVGPENVWDLMNVRMCDRIGTGRPKESPYRLRKYQSMIEEALRSPLTVGMLKINGTDIMSICELKPGREIGYILHALLEEVLENPELNTKEYLENRANMLAKLPIDELKKIGEKAKLAREEEDEKIVEEIRKKYWVK